MQSDDETSSDESTAASAPSETYRCPQCFKVFGSGQALGGHQNAHRIHRAVRRVTNSMGAAAANRNHPIAQSVPAAPAENFQPITNGPGSKVKLGHGILQLQPVDARAAHDDQEPPMKRTKDYLGKWVPIYGVNGGENSKRSSEKTTIDPLVRVPKGVDNGDHEVDSKTKEDMDLELKLGF